MNWLCNTELYNQTNGTSYRKYNNLEKKETTEIFPCSGSQGTAYSQEMFVMPLDSYNITVSYRSPGSFSLVLSEKT